VNSRENVVFENSKYQVSANFQRMAPRTAHTERYVCENIDPRVVETSAVISRNPMKGTKTGPVHLGNHVSQTKDVTATDKRLLARDFAASTASFINRVRILLDIWDITEQKRNFAN
jgi:hypothetical protein